MRVLALTLLALAASPAAATTWDLPATPQTVAWGHYDASDKPALVIQSGDTVVMHTLLTNNPTGLAKAGVAAADIQPELRAVYDGVPASARGPGGHILTGPVAIEGAEPGDTLEVRVLKIDMDIPYAYNAFRYGAGFLTDDFPYAPDEDHPARPRAHARPLRSRRERAAAPVLRQHGRGAASRLRSL